MTTSIRLFFAACLVAGASLSTSADQVFPLDRVMHEKLDHSQAILKAVLTSDWATLDRASRALALTVRDPAWTAALTEREYIRQSDAFSRALQDLIEASATRDLETAGNAQINLTITCVRCHAHMARRRLAK